MKTSVKQPCFLAESTLGRLAKWLVLAGLDTVYDTQSPDAVRLVQASHRESRTLLTRTRAIADLAAEDVIFITANAPMDQVRQVMREMEIGPQALRPLTRCVCCNFSVQTAPESMYIDRVPEHVLRSHTLFRFCPQCRRIYWRGTHAERWLAFIDQWFEDL